MKAEKQGKFIVFYLDDGGTCKYDLSNGNCYGKSGKKVKSLNGILTKYTVNDVDDLFSFNPYYAEFLKYVNWRRNLEIGRWYYFHDYNLGTLLKYVNEYSIYEQFFSAGFTRSQLPDDLDRPIGEIPKWLRTFCLNVKNKCLLGKSFLNFYQKYPDYVQTILQNEYFSLNKDIIMNFFDDNMWSYCLKSLTELNEKYGYNIVDLFTYMDRLITFEAVNDITWIINELNDYARMMSIIGNKFDRYPRHFKTTMDIATRNYNQLKKEFPEDMFQKRINKDYEFIYKGFKFVYPNSVQDIKDEAIQQHNCVASYIDRVLDGECHIMFLRESKNEYKSLVTVEVRNGRIVQARQKFNDPLNEEQQEAVDAWNKHFNKSNIYNTRRINNELRGRV